MTVKNKIKDYIELIFADAPDCKQTRELKEEMYHNVCDKYDDLVREGKSETAAYNASIAGIGDISELIDKIREENGYSGNGRFGNPYSANGAYQNTSNDFDTYAPESEPVRQFSAEEKEQIRKYRLRRGILNSVAVAMYITCWVPLIIIAPMGLFGALSGVIGIAILMLMVAGATAMMIMKSAIKPECLRGVKELEDDDDEDDIALKARGGKRARRVKNPILRAISAVMWPITIIVYLGVSFLSGAWHITWMIFLISTAIEGIVESIFELCGKKYVS